MGYRGLLIVPLCVRVLTWGRATRTARSPPRPRGGRAPFGGTSPLTPPPATPSPTPSAPRTAPARRTTRSTTTRTARTGRRSPFLAPVQALQEGDRDRDSRFSPQEDLRTHRHTAVEVGSRFAGASCRTPALASFVSRSRFAMVVD
ncbi:hypothetical protein B0H11DRAFT_1993449, partial [Mycena galericulata]